VHYAGAASGIRVAGVARSSQPLVTGQPVGSEPVASQPAGRGEAGVGDAGVGAGAVGTSATSAAGDPNAIYLTFDDGPDPKWTPQILALLGQYGVPATFFEIGQQVRLYPQASAAVRAAGQTIGSHTMHHRNLTKLSGVPLTSELDAGLPGVTCLRPPFGDVNAKVRTAAAARGLHIVLWNVDTRDWAKPGVAPIERELLAHARPGRTVLMHDGGGDRSQTVAALRVVLPQLVARGYRFATVPGC
jgi:peptidoglycan/xylan/chitin deacetylase (PgdA/CDA1 family)